MSDPDDISDLLGAWRVGPALSAIAPGAGTIHRTLLIATAAGEYALRGYRYGEIRPIADEHALIAYAGERGVPAVAPLALPGGGTILERAGRFFALFPRAPGRQIARQNLRRGDASAMGRCLAELHRALAAFPAELARRRSLDADPAAALATIARVEQAIRARSAADEIDLRALRALAERRAWIERAGARPQGIGELDQQVIHGDYQETNLFFARGRVSAVIDWDQAYLAPRAWEVVRTMHLALGFQAGLCRAFLAGYRASRPLAAPELDLTARYYAWLRAHDLWVYQSLYLEGNQRVRAFVEPDGFAPLIDRWRELRESL